MKHILAFAEREEAVPSNRLRYFRLGFEQKPICFLNADAVKRIETARLDEHLRHFADLFLLQCETGLAYADLLRFGEYRLQMMQGRLCLVGERQKSTVVFCVPITEKAKRLLTTLTDSSGRLPVPTNQHYNKMLKYIQGITGIKKKLTTHLARKTAGMVWLNDGYSLESVSHMLGHTSIKTTQRWYARVLPTRVLREADEIEARHRTAATA